MNISKFENFIEEKVRDRLEISIINDRLIYDLSMEVESYGERKKLSLEEIDAIENEILNRLNW